MILKSVGFSFLFLVVYLLVVDLLQWPSRTVNQWEDNNRLVERFLYEIDHQKINTIIVGSSMAFRMTAVKDDYPDSIYNLSLGGQSIYEGLEIIRRSGQHPKYLLIESNLIGRAPKPDYVDAVFTPVLYQLKERFDGFRYEYRPITLMQYLYYGAKNRIFSPMDLSFTDVGTTKNEIDQDSHAVEKELRETIAKQSENFENVGNEVYQTDMLSDIVRYFVQAGVIVMFFEMPTESLELNSNKNIFIRDFIHTRFPNNELILAQKIYPTTDGVHLSVSNANNYLGILLQKMKQI